MLMILWGNSSLNMVKGMWKGIIQNLMLRLKRHSDRYLSWTVDVFPNFTVPWFSIIISIESVTGELPWSPSCPHSVSSLTHYRILVIQLRDIQRASCLNPSFTNKLTYIAKIFIHDDFPLVYGGIILSEPSHQPRSNKSSRPPGP